MATNFAVRSHQAEMMDQAIEDKNALFVNLRELEKINQLTGGPASGFKAIQKLLKNQVAEVHIVDVGFGAGDMLLYLLANAHKLTCPIKITGVDLMPETLEYINKYHPQLPTQVRLELCDYRDWFARGGSADVIHAGLFCHHLNDKELIEFFTLTKQAKIGVVVNDLARAMPPYYFIKWATALFSKSVFTKNDAPLSVLRGFKKHELTRALNAAGVNSFSLKWKWAYRYLLTIKNQT